MQENGVNVWEEINQKSGFLYCDGEEGFYRIVAECLKGSAKTLNELYKAYHEKDYPFYIIKIHAMKTTTKLIGAMQLSEEAKTLELAGKAGEYETIENGHEAVMEHYRRLFRALAAEPEVQKRLDPDFDLEQELLKVETYAGGEPKAKPAPVPPKQEAKPAEAELSQEELTLIWKSYEKAMYALDVMAMKSVAQSLAGYRVGTTSLTDFAKELLQKIEKEDYFSAGDLFSRMLSKLHPEG